MQWVHDYLLAMDEISRDLLINAVLLLFDLVILALLLPFAIEWWEDRKWSAMRQSLLVSTLDLIESAFTHKPVEVPGAFIDAQRHAGLDDAVFGKLQLFSAALTPGQSAAVANAVELSLQLVRELDRIRMNDALVQSAMAGGLAQKHDRELHSEVGRWGDRMLFATVQLAALPLRERCEAICALFATEAEQAEARERCEAIVARVDKVIESSRGTLEQLIGRSPRTAYFALMTSRAHQTAPEHFEAAWTMVQDVFAKWELEQDIADRRKAKGLPT